MSLPPLLRAASCLLAAGAVGCASQGAPPPVADAPPALVTLGGYVDVMGVTVLLFPTRASAEADDWASCVNVGSDERLFAHLSKLIGKRVRIGAEDLGTTFSELFHSGDVAIYRLRGRPVEPLCDNPRTYWAQEGLAISD